MSIKKYSAAALFIILILMTGCGQAGKSQDEGKTVNIFAMDTFMTMTAYGENAETALEKASKEINRLDILLSTGNPESEIYKLNEAGHGILSYDSSYLLRESLRISSLTGGAFNPLIYPLMEVWGFTDKNYKVPKQSTIDDLLLLTDTEDIDMI
ncbi:MAG: FAD:protein FMN transferase, partial [Parasporobacterium sp.]|nr:FAD:protein FMN transferase [Parasporobacterium sp.]